MKKLLWLPMLISFFMVSCSSDDGGNNEEENTETAQIIGTWKHVSATVDGDPLEPISCDLFLIFTENEFTEEEYYGENCEFLDSITEEYTFNGSTIFVTSPDGDYTLNVSDLNEENLVLQITDPDTGAVIVATYERVE